jgi:hypothetical protein
MVNRIPHAGARRAVMMAFVLAVSLALGFTLEKTTSPATLTSLHKAQDDWIATIGAMTPLGLAQGYLGDIDAALKGKWIYEPPPGPIVPSPAIVELQQRIDACNTARMARTLQPTCAEQLRDTGLTASSCMVRHDDPACVAYLACLDQTPIIPLTPPECEGVPRFPILSLTPSAEGASAPDSSQSTHVLLIPLASIVHGVTRITHDGLSAILLAGFQLLVGFAAFVALSRALNSGRIGFGDGWMNYTLGPISVIGLGSLVALVLQGVMLGSLIALSWVTGLAAGAAGATGIIGGLWWAGTKLAEKGIEDALTKSD